MGSKAELETSSTPQLPLFSIPPMLMQSPGPSGMLTPPLHTLASVPFRWEEEPGKPRPCTALTICNPINNCLELPPRLLTESKFTKTSSPTTVLDGPYVGRLIFHSSSIRYSPERGQLGSMVLSKRGNNERGLFGSWGKRAIKIKGGKKNGGGDDEENGTRVKMARIRRNGSFTSLSEARSHFWAAIYKGFKQVIPWSSKSKKKGLIN